MCVWCAQNAMSETILNHTALVSVERNSFYEPKKKGRKTIAVRVLKICSILKTEALPWKKAINSHPTNEQQLRMGCSVNWSSEKLFSVLMAPV